MYDQYFIFSTVFIPKDFIQPVLLCPQGREKGAYLLTTLLSVAQTEQVWNRVLTGVMDLNLTSISLSSEAFKDTNVQASPHIY